MRLSNALFHVKQKYLRSFAVKNVTGNAICTQGLGVKIFDKFWDLVTTEILLPLTTPTIT